MTTAQNNYIAAYESHHVAYREPFPDYQKAATFMHGWTTDVHTWPICIYDSASDHLWLWCGYRTMDIGRETALEDARGILGLPPDHQFAKVETMSEYT
jgi:hypothetical protein